MNETLIRIILDILVVIMIILVILWKAVAQRKNGRAMVDLEMIPGHSEECERRGTELTKQGEQQKFLVDTVGRIDKNVTNLWKYVKKNGIT